MAGGGGVWVAALLWIGVASSLCGAVKDPLQETPDHMDYKFDSNYIAMKKAANSVNIPNPDVMVMHGVETAGFYYAVTHRLAGPLYRHLSKNASEVYVAVVNGMCMSPPSNSAATCLTEREARALLLKEARLALHSAAAMIAEAGVKARLQWFKENGVDDIVLIISANAQNLLRDVFAAVYAPAISLSKQIFKFRSILVERYLSGSGSADKMVAAADAVSSEVYTIIGAIISKQYPIFKFYHSTQERVDQYNVMFQDHLETVLSSPQLHMYKDSPYPFISRYWDARALEYAVTWLFRMRKEAQGSDIKEFDKVLMELYTKLEGGENEEALQYANHLLSKAMDRLGHKIVSKYLNQPPLQIAISGLPLPLPLYLQDLNPLGVPRSLRATETSSTEKFLQHYLDEVEEDSASKHLFEQLVSLM